VPAGGLVPMTVPASTVSLGWLTCLMVRPRLPSVLAAVAGSCPETSGIWTCCFPVETKRVMIVPFSTWLPAGGSVRVTLPASTVSLFSCWTL